jgi:hypothetical protein
MISHIGTCAHRLLHSIFLVLLLYVCHSFNKIAQRVVAMKRRVFFLTALALVFIAFLIYLFTAVQHQETSVPRFTKHKYSGERLLLYPQVHGINKKAAARINATLEKAGQNSYKNATNLKRAGTFTKKKNARYSYNSAYNVINNKHGMLSILYRDYMWPVSKSEKIRI